MKAEMPERARKVGGGTAEDTGILPRQADTARRESTGDGAPLLMEEVLRRENLKAAYKRVVANKGAAGVDGISVHELKAYLVEHWARIREELLSGSYRPGPVRRVEIPKPGGKGTRMLGIPTTLDRLMQQALLQVLTPIFDPTFSEESFGFRPGRSTHQAVLRAREHMAAGHRWVVDVDLEKFFDRVNHDVLMARVARRVKDKRVLRLIRRYLQAGIMEGGLVSPRTEGTPQGSPLSPLLSNILLDELDKELERRGHRFVRYADDCNVYVQSKAAGERVLDERVAYLISDILSDQQLQDAQPFYVHTFSSTIFINQGNGRFEATPLPVQAQIAPVYDMVIADFFGNDQPDILVAGNNFGNRPEMGPTAGQGVLLKATGELNYTALLPNETGFYGSGDVRKLEWIPTRFGPLFFLGRYGEPAVAHLYRAPE